MNNQYLTVTALTKYIRRKLEIDPHLQQVLLKGEISNFTRHSRGHFYLTIKDDHSRIQAVMFQGDNRHLKFTPENGMQVLIKGNISVFEPYGQYQLYIRSMEPDGIGALYLAYEQLKEKLQRAGYFDQQHKQSIPAFPKQIAIITSPTGAAVRDIITTIKRRFPIVQLTVLPVLVQGNEAAQSIRQAIEYANKLGEFDTIILGRGGGSIEELWSFNEEQVVKAIFDSKIPIVTGIGHETDITISDFVADLRAPTPTGAAELVVPNLVDLQHRVSYLSNKIAKLAQIIHLKKAESLNILQNSRGFHYPQQLLREKEQHLDRLMDYLKESSTTILHKQQRKYEQLHHRLQLQHPSKRLSVTNQKVIFITKQLQQQALNTYRDKQTRVETLIDKLTLLNPLHVMKRGFTISYTASNEIVKSTSQVKIDDKLRIQLLDGTVKCNVEEVKKDNHE